MFVNNLLMSNFKTQNEKNANPAKTYVRKILPTRNCRCEFIKNLIIGQRAI